MSKVRELLARKRKEVQLRKRDLPYAANPSRQLSRDRSFHIFSEIKRSSLSAGAIRPALDLARIARAYEGAGASAISVLTEEHYFGGSLKDLRSARAAVEIPLLQKDFVIDPFQIFEAKHAGADFVLLISRFLSKSQLHDFLEVCDRNLVQGLVEVTDESDLEKLPDSVRFVGVNARDLETLTIDTTKFAKLRPLLPSNAVLIAESGIRNTGHLKELVDLGYHGALIGEHFLRCEDPAEEVAKFVRSLIPSSSRKDKTKVKVCGITNEADALAAIACGASALGFIFAESPRRIDPQVLSQFRTRLDNKVLKVGVFKGQSAAEIYEIMKRFDLDVAQVYDPVALNLQNVWTARIVQSEKDLSNLQGKILWDIKCDPQTIWPKLHEIFALAGGLDASNVRKAIQFCNPEWVDVARGVEAQPGRKDRKKLEMFMKEIV